MRALGALPRITVQCVQHISVATQRKHSFGPQGRQCDDGVGYKQLLRLIKATVRAAA